MLYFLNFYSALQVFLSTFNQNSLWSSKHLFVHVFFHKYLIDFSVMWRKIMSVIFFLNYTNNLIKNQFQLKSFLFNTIEFEHDMLSQWKLSRHIWCHWQNELRMIIILTEFIHLIFYKPLTKYKNSTESGVLSKTDF